MAIAGLSHFGCVEAGGTKFVCGLADGDGRWLSRRRIATADPASTLDQVAAFLRRAQDEHGPMLGLGLASFGPIVVDRSRPDWGSMMKTPKSGWSGVSIVEPLRAALGVPVELDTDVNAAALAEADAAGPSAPNGIVYVTVGTGIGGGAVFDGRALQGYRHPEMGHVRPPRHPLDNEFPGCCPYHGACLEGLASGSAIVARWGRPLSELGADHPAHEITAWYLGQFAASLVAILSPSRITLGGGVMQTPGLLARIRSEADRAASGYLAEPGAMTQIIQPPSLGDDAGLRGALLLARRARPAARPT